MLETPVTPAPAMHLHECLARYRSVIPGLDAIAAAIAADATTASLIEYYERCYPLLEQAMWSGRTDFDALLACYQALFREQEALIRQQAAADGSGDQRFRFIISIPVADRPAHLRTCLESIYQVCERFGYGGMQAGVYTHVRVIVAEDSREQNHVRAHMALAAEYTARGLQVVHFGLDEQYALLQSIPDGLRARLGNLLTIQPRERFYHKGQAANRNLSVLKCLQLTTDKARTLYYFVDSDESFRVNRLTGTGETAVTAVNYFHAIDRIYRGTDTLLLTGRMVGDPPVSPSVMAVNFLDDITAFLAELAQLPADAPCRFHGLTDQDAAALAAGAVYHDMAGLFGYHNRCTTFPYRCLMQGPHDHMDCLRAFTDRLSAFFFGVHPTRSTLFAYGSGFTGIAPARTVYPGNTIARYEGLKYIIPFGHLRLRMSGPTAGRLISAEIGARFATANLPHLHRRTNEAGLDDAFRPGVKLSAGQARDSIDLSGEFERQFFGDLLLFTSEALLREADAHMTFGAEQVLRVMDRKEQELLGLYRQEHEAIAQKAHRLDELVFHAGHWWQDAPELDRALRQIEGFIANVRHNFSEWSPGWRQIRSAAHRAERRQQLVQALVNYRSERDAWDSLFD